MKKQDQETEIEIIFHNDLTARNKLVRFIINKILEDYDKLGGFIDGDRGAK